MSSQNENPKDTLDTTTEQVGTLTIKKTPEAPLVTRDQFHRLITVILKEAGITTVKQTGNMTIESEGITQSSSITCRESIIRILQKGFEQKGIPVRVGPYDKIPKGSLLAKASEEVQ